MEQCSIEWLEIMTIHSTRIPFCGYRTYYEPYQQRFVVQEPESGCLSQEVQWRIHETQITNYMLH
jgi:hypothetical protein